jgi:hypothetical protein
MTTPSVALCASCALIASASASASFTGYSGARVTTASGNTRYTIYANFSAANVVFLGAFNWQNLGGPLNARHQDAFTADGEVGTWQAGSSVSAADRGEDSWVTASGLATASGWGTALDPGFANGGTVRDINNGAGWYDATPGTPNLVLAGGTQGGYRMLIMQIVRTGDDSGCQGGNSDILFSLQVSYRVTGSTTTVGQGSIAIFCPAPGAMSLLLAGGIAQRRRRV